jgi:hypothetical protein
MYDSEKKKGVFSEAVDLKAIEHIATELPAIQARQSFALC